MDKEHQLLIKPSHFLVSVLTCPATKTGRKDLQKHCVATPSPAPCSDLHSVHGNLAMMQTKLFLTGSNCRIASFLLVNNIINSSSSSSFFIIIINDSSSTSCSSSFSSYSSSSSSSYFVAAAVAMLVMVVMITVDVLLMLMMGSCFIVPDHVMILMINDDGYLLDDA